jgi:hypothetical protein
MWKANGKTNTVLLFLDYFTKTETNAACFLWRLNCGSEIPGTLRSVRLEKDGEDQCDRSCQKWRSITQSQGGEECPIQNERRRVNWIGHILLI